MNEGLQLVIEAAAFAADKHRKCRRKDIDSTPYINHPLSLAKILIAEAGIDDPVVIAAALLHDTIEDTETTEDELRAAFGSEVSQVVAEVTDNKKFSKDTRKLLQIQHAAHISNRAKLVKLSDKIANLRDIRILPPQNWDESRKREYLNWSSQVVEAARGASPKLYDIFQAELAHFKC